VARLGRPVAGPASVPRETYGKPPLHRTEPIAAVDDRHWFQAALLAEEILNLLTKIPSIKVIARTRLYAGLGVTGVMRSV
jgi:hypothetical protein